MDTKVLDVLLTVVETGSLTAAADQLGYTQPAVTHMIQNLEAEVGFPLLIRDKKGARFTENGTKLMPVIKAHVRATNDFYEKANQIKRLKEGTLTIYTIKNLTINWLSKIIMYFRDDYPNIKIRIDEESADTAEDILNERQADFAIVIDTGDTDFGKDIEHIPLYEDSPVALLPRNHSLASAEIFPIKAFEEYPFIMQEGFTEFMYHELLEKNGVIPRISANTTSDINLVSRVESGFGLSLRSSQTMMNIRHGSILTKPLDQSMIYRVCLAYKKSDRLSPAVRSFIKYTIDFNNKELALKK